MVFKSCCSLVLFNSIFIHSKSYIFRVHDFFTREKFDMHSINQYGTLSQVFRNIFKTTFSVLWGISQTRLKMSALSAAGGSKQHCCQRRPDSRRRSYFASRWCNHFLQFPIVYPTVLIVFVACKMLEKRICLCFGQ